MRYQKITTGYVIQEWDESGNFLSQNFVAGDECTYEKLDEETFESTPIDEGDMPTKAGYVPYDMVQQFPETILPLDEVESEDDLP